MPRHRPDDNRAVQCGGTGTAGSAHADPRLQRAASSGAFSHGASRRRHDVQRPAAHYCGCRKAPLSASSRQHALRPVQGRGQGGGVQPRQALPLRRAGVVSTSEAGTDDAGNVTSRKVELRVFRTNDRLTRLFSAVRKVATCLPRDLQMKRLTQRWIDALQGRQAYPHCGKTGSHSALPTSATASADMQIRAIFTYLTEVSGTHA